MSVIIRLQGLSWSASSMDIRNFFKNLSIPPGGVHIIGGDNGDAFIAFSSDEDARLAMQLNNGLLNEQPVMLFLSSKTEMQNTIKQAKEQTSTPVPMAQAVPATNIAAPTQSQAPNIQALAGLGLQENQMAQLTQILAGFQNSNSATPAVTPSVVGAQPPKVTKSNPYEEALPGEYSLGGLPKPPVSAIGTNQPSGKYGHLANQGHHPITQPAIQQQNAFAPNFDNKVPPVVSSAGFPQNQTPPVWNSNFQPPPHQQPPPQQPALNNPNFPAPNSNMPRSNNSVMQFGSGYNLPPPHDQHQPPVVNPQFGHHGAPLRDQHQPIINPQFGHHGAPPLAQHGALHHDQRPPIINPKLGHHGVPPYPPHSQTGAFGQPANSQEKRPPFGKPEHLNAPPSVTSIYSIPSQDYGHFGQTGNIQQNKIEKNDDFSKTNINQPIHQILHQGQTANKNTPTDSFNRNDGPMDRLNRNDTPTGQNLRNDGQRNFYNRNEAQPEPFNRNAGPRDTFNRNESQGDSYNRNQDQREPLNVNQRNQGPFNANQGQRDALNRNDRQSSNNNFSSQNERPNDRQNSNNNIRNQNERPGTRFGTGVQPNLEKKTDASNALNTEKQKTQNSTKPEQKSLDKPTVIQTEKLDAFGRNIVQRVPDKTGNDKDSKPETDKSDKPETDSSRRSREKDRSSRRRDSPSRRDRDRRDRDRDREKGRDRDDDRKSRRDRDNDRDRDRKNRDRDDDKRDRRKDIDKNDKRNSPASSDSSRRLSRKRSLSPKDNKDSGDKKLQTEKPSTVVTKPIVTSQSPMSSSGGSPFTSRSSAAPIDIRDLNVSKPANFPSTPSFSSQTSSTTSSVSTSKPVSSGLQPLFPVISPLESRKGLLGFSPSALTGTPKMSSMINQNQNTVEPMDMDISSSPEQHRSNLFQKDRAMNAGLGNSGPPELRRAPLLDSRPPFFEGKPPLLDGRPSQMDGRPPFFNDRPPHLDGRRFDEKPPHMDGRPPRFDDMPPHLDQMRPRLDDGPQHFEDRPPHIESRPLLGDRPAGMIPHSDRQPGDRNIPPFQGPPDGRRMSDGPFPPTNPSGPRPPFMNEDDRFNRPPFDRPDMPLDRPGPNFRPGPNEMDRNRPLLDTPDFRGPIQEGPDFRGPPMDRPGRDPRNNREEMDRRGDMGPMGPRDDDRPFDRRDGRPPLDRPGDRGPLDRRVDGPPFDRIGDRGPLDIRPPFDIRNDRSSIERRDGPPFDRRNDRPFDPRDDIPPFDHRGPFNDDMPPFDRPDIRPPFDRPDNRPPFDRRDDRPGRMNEDRPPFGNRGDRPPFDLPGDRPPFERGDVRPPFDRPVDGPPFERGNDRPPFDRRGDRPPFERGDGRPPFDRKDDRPPFERGDGRPPFDRTDDRPPFKRGVGRPPFDRKDDRPPLERGDGRPPFDRQGGRPPFDRRDDIGSRQGRDGDFRDRRGDQDNRERGNERNVNNRGPDDKRDSSRRNDTLMDDKGHVRSRQDSRDDRSQSKDNDNKRGNQSETSTLCTISLENIPDDSTYKDIRKLFNGCDIPRDGIKIINNKEGKRVGKALIKFAREESFKQALTRDRNMMKQRVVRIKPIQRKEYDNEVDAYTPPSVGDDISARDRSKDIDMCNTLSATLRTLKGDGDLPAPTKQQPPQQKKTTNLQPEFVVRLGLLPSDMTLKDVREFFDGCEIAENGQAVYLDFDNNTKQCKGTCFIEFSDSKGYQGAFRKKRMYRGKTITISTAFKKDIDSLLSKLQKNASGEKTGTKVVPKSDNANDKSKLAQNTPEKQTSPQITPQSPLSLTTCVRLSNMPDSTTHHNVRNSFGDLNIAPRGIQICHDAVGKPVGECYVEFTNKQDVQNAISKNITIGQNKVLIEAIAKDKMIANMRYLRQSIRPERPTNQAVFFFVKASNLPIGVTTGEIMRFFQGYHPAPESIRLNIGDTDERHGTSTALIGFRDKGEAEKAVEKINQHMLRDKKIVITKVIL